MTCKSMCHPSYCVTELLDTDLKRVIDKEHAKLNQDHFKLFLY